MASNPLLVYGLKFLCLNKPTSTSYKPPDIIRYFFVLISSFASIIALEATFQFSPVFIQHSVPHIVPSWAATIILTCNALESPLGQPFNLFFGTFFSSILGVGLTKIWMLNQSNEATLWVCGALALALSSVLMTHAKMVHPAAGSAALLCAINPEIRHLGWYYLVVQIVTALIVMGVAAVFANIYAQYPLYWALPPKLTKAIPILPSPPVPDVTPVEEESKHTPSSAYSTGSTETHVNDSADNDSLYSLSRIATVQETLHATTTHLVSSVSHALTRVITDSRYLHPIISATVNNDRLASEFPNLDFESTALVSSSDFSFPNDIQFTAEDRGILISIQRKLEALEG